MKHGLRDVIGLTVTVACALLLMGVGARAWIANSQEDDALPLGLAAPTSTPDLRRATTPDDARAALASVNPGFGEVVAAVEKGDVDGLLNLINWSERSCGSADAPAYCPGASKGDVVDALDVGDVTFFVTADGLRPSLEVVLGGAPALSIAFAAHHRNDAAIYYVGFDAPVAKGRGVLPVTNSDTELAGILLTLDSTAHQPIVDIEFASPEFPSAAVVPVQRVDDLEIWLWSDTAE